MQQKSILIIGAGVSGLSAGIYALQQGFKATILEKNPSVGGLCTGWYRKGHYVDGCIHWLTGTLPGTMLHQMWQNVGAFSDDKDIIQLDSWGSFEHDGQVVTFWRDLAKAEKEWINISPVDKKHIHRFFKMVKDFISVELPVDIPPSMMNIKQLFNMFSSVLKVWPSYLPTMGMSCEKYAKRFKSSAIRWAITHAQPGPGNLFSMIYSYASISKGDGGIPKGGSKPMVERMKDKFLSLGGTLKLNTEVSNILIDNKKCIGVRTTKEECLYADYTVCCLDPNYVTHKLLLGMYQIPSLEKRFSRPYKHETPSCCVFSFVSDKLQDINYPYSFDVEPFKVGTATISHLTLRSYGYDDTYINDGQTVCSVLIDQYVEDYHYWNKLYKEDKKAYRLEKERIASIIKQKLIEKFPDLNNHLTLIDSFTPKTLSRYTNASRGAFMGFLFHDKAPMWTFRGKFKGLNNLYLSGQWMQCPGGLPIAMVQGMFSIQRICKKERQNYIFVDRRLLSIKHL